MAIRKRRDDDAPKWAVQEWQDLYEKWMQDPRDDGDDGYLPLGDYIYEYASPKLRIYMDKERETEAERRKQGIYAG